MSAEGLQAAVAAGLPSLVGWVRQAVITALLAVLAVAAGQGVRLVWRRLLLPLARRTRTQLDLALVTSTERAASRAASYLILYVAARRLAEQPQLAGTLYARIIDGLFFGLAVVGVSRLAVAAVDGLTRWYLSEVARRTQSSVDDQFLPVLGRVVAVVAYFLAGTVVLDRFGVSVTALVTTAGVASLAVALAAQETLANMFAGFTILLHRSYRVGDRIQLPDGTIGDVYDIGLRSTKILSFDNEMIVVPNKEMASARIVNQSSPNPLVKLRVKVGVAYGTDLRRAKAIILDVCRSHPKVLAEPPPAVYFTEFGESSLNLLAICAVADYRDRFGVLDELNMAIKERFEQEGIEIPFPQRDLHVRSLPPWLMAPQPGVAADVPAHSANRPPAPQEGGP